MNTLDKYENIKYLGKGAFGVVKLYRDKRTKEKVAIKIINKKKNDDINVKNKEEYYSKLDLLEKENKLLKNEIKESKNRISILEYKIEELLDDKNSKENNECPQPTPYVIKYSKDLMPSKSKPKIDENSQEKILKTNNDILREYSKNETKESEASNRICSK